MAHYSISAEGNYSLSDLEAKLKEITDWNWNDHEEGSSEYESGLQKFHAALHVLESLRVATINAGDPKMVNKTEIQRIYSVWNRFSPEKYHRTV